jgi:hypothetical protein
MSTDRRDFFRKIGQLSCLTALIAGTGYLVAEKRISLNGCSTNQLCSQCRKIETCSLDAAREQRKNLSPGLSSNSK